ncbi:MAG: hypothetical protein KC516_04805 [Nanoarchaeota archaeon]|nr:hypothetical protein [Nanoarchaeota archaeon]
MRGIPGPGQINGIFGTEVLYAFVIILACLMIYFGTRELYKLSSHKGIKYFRESFLFLAIAFFFRFLLKFLLLFFDARKVVEIYPAALAGISLFIFLYFNLIAIFYLLYSVVWKKLKNPKYGVAIIHIAAVVISLVTIFFNELKFYLGVNILLLIALGLILFAFSREGKGKLNLVYMLFFLFLTLNSLEILIPEVLETFELAIYFISLGVFLLLGYKVIRKTG